MGNWLALFPFMFFLYYTGKGCLNHDTYNLVIGLYHLIIAKWIWNDERPDVDKK